uniref:DUF223 domain-containing protein n=1 Tax=Lactuca sativa TaxID=4236 RepID=A0A9R1VR12_LACSA|nr:hypothetical protein LSAT_V11C400196810 [Lactuca sativa]
MCLLSEFPKLFLHSLLPFLKSAFNCLQEMNKGNKVYLKNIEHIVDDSHIKVRVVKMWNFRKNNVVLAIEMIVIDVEGIKYHSRVFNQNFSRFCDLLKGGQTYIIIKPNMAALNNGFSAMGPVNGFVFVDFNSVIEQIGTRDSFFDVIGQAVSFRALDTSNLNPSNHYIKMTINYLQFVQLNVTIFGTQAHQISQ